MGADKMGLSDDQLVEIIARWRAANKRIVDLWYSMESAAMAAMQTGMPVGNARCTFAMESSPERRFMTITLPSGRKLYYPEPHIEMNQFGRPALHYWGTDQKTGKWGRVSTYGGKLVENVVQAIARDCLAVALVRVADAGYQTVMHIHDEIVVDAPAAPGRLESLCRRMGEPISWAPGLLLRAEGFETEFYKKD